MNAFIEVAYMTLQSISRAMFDIYFIFAIIISYLTVVRFKQIDFYTKPVMKNAKELVTELIVQGIVIGIVLSFVVTLLGFPMIYTEYLYFILPLSLILGFYHVRYTNVVYGGMLLAVLSQIFNGQEIGNITLPEIDLNVSGLLGVVGILLVIEGILLYLLRHNSMVPIMAKKDDKVILGYGFQRFWPIPLVLLVVTQATAATESSVQMPLWWPILKDIRFDQMDYLVFMLPMLFVLSHGTLSFTKSPTKQMKDQSIVYLVSGIILLSTGFVIMRNPTFELIGAIVFCLVALVPERLEAFLENSRKPCYIIEGKGVRIIHVTKGSIADSRGIKAGDVIIKVNEIEVTNLFQYNALIKDSTVLKLCISQLLKPDMETKLSLSELKPKVFGATYLQENPSKIYAYEQVKDMGILKMMRGK